MRTLFKVSKEIRTRYGRTVHVEISVHPCTHQDGSLAYYAYLVRYRDWPVHRIGVLPEWQGDYSTNVFSVRDICGFFNHDTARGARAEKAFRKFLETHIHAERFRTLRPEHQTANK